MAKKRKRSRRRPVSNELRDALLRLNDILDNLDLCEHQLTIKEVGLLQEFLTEIAEPLNHRRPTNWIRDAIIAGDVVELLENNVKPQAAYDAAAQMLVTRSDVHLDSSRIGQIHRRMIKPDGLLIIDRR